MLCQVKLRVVRARTQLVEEDEFEHSGMEKERSGAVVSVGRGEELFSVCWEDEGPPPPKPG